jgi:FKBP-type peptidyl-prolyl cis-trans isomerase SlyD
MSNQTVQKNKHVMFSYTIVDSDRGDVLEQVEIPMGYIHGGDQRMFDEVEQAMEGAAIGDEIEVTLPAEKTFGAPDPELIFTESLENVPPQFHRVGAEVEFQNEQGDIKSFTVTSIQDGKITIDGNSPLIGKNLTFKVIIHDIRDATEREIETGRPSMPSLH